MKDHRKAAIVNELTHIAREYGHTQQLRSRIAAVVLPALMETTARPKLPYRVALFESSANPGTQVRMIVEGADVAAYEMRSDFIRWDDLEDYVLEENDYLEGLLNTVFDIVLGRGRVAGRFAEGVQAVRDAMEFTTEPAAVVKENNHCPEGESDELNKYLPVGMELFARGASFQARVRPWLVECFGEQIASDRVERNHRFFEESTELVQSCGMTREDAHALVDYVYGRPAGEPAQEMGGVMVTLAALGLANGLDMRADGEAELARICEPSVMEKIRAKQASKPRGSALPFGQVEIDVERRCYVPVALREHGRDPSEFKSTGGVAYRESVRDVERTRMMVNEALDKAAAIPRAYCHQLDKAGWGKQYPDELTAMFNASDNMSEKIKALKT